MDRKYNGGPGDCENAESKKGWLTFYDKKSLTERSAWYSASGQNYARYRPRYPQDVIDAVIQLTGLKKGARILELGCGPGTLTQDLGKLGFEIVAVEPSDMHLLAQEICGGMPNVRIANSTFEDFDLGAQAPFDAVVCATAFHWLSPDARYLKTARALAENGWLILLWNGEACPDEPTRRRFASLYAQYAPSIDRVTDRENMAKLVRDCTAPLIELGLFTELKESQGRRALRYTSDQYLCLLGTYSQYIKLAETDRLALFEGIKEIIDQDMGGEIDLTYTSAYQVARKVT